MKTWKIVLIIWGPIIILAIAYGTAYLVRYEHVRHSIKQSQTAFNNCENPPTPVNSHYDKSTGVLTITPNTAPPFVPNCQTAGALTHGFLWLPGYKAGDYN